MSADRKAGISLSFVIVGAGIAGLAAAYRLRVAGHEVCILEKRNGPATGETAITLPPNMSRILYRWGLESKLQELALHRTAMTFKSCETGETTIEYLYSEGIIQDLGAATLMMKHKDLHSILYALAVEIGVDIRFSAEVSSIDPWAPSVTLSSSEVVTADVVVGADGIKSVVRPYVSGGQNEADTDDIPVPLDAMTGDGELRLLLETPTATIWRGKGHTIYGCPLSGDRGYSLKMAFPPGGYEVGEDYDQTYEAAKLHLDTSSCEPRVQKLLRRMERFYPVIWKVRPALASLLHDSKKVVLIGEAAHTVVPNLVHNAALGIEDAAVLAELASRIRRQDEVERLLSAYDEIRYSRGLALVYSEVANMRMMCMISEESDHPYSKQFSEDQDIWVRSPTVVGIPDDTIDPEIMLRWDRHLKTLNHDVYDDVDEWWHVWGRYMRGDLEEDAHGSVATGKAASFGK
ncbi:FAD/NAD(P)-binding domain-containing protein [Heliocybe sulcata]|uniref:FAD/NAD(P)-binding domain-containing protein n=1 Tax=Heliocybe sulcata TaxID=5364 RepID=A0A5C3NEQ7_9AGAM|nr:FAD/NAD(P)-binding domain-containing protein [Heliocybe sulcata]